VREQLRSDHENHRSPSLQLQARPHVEITPDADRVLILIGGKNAQGKSSLLDALTVAFGGKRRRQRIPFGTAPTRP
jgi:DNA repair exonuclease SbcCD ATPase subunit